VPRQAQGVERFMELVASRGQAAQKLYEVSI
jgi:hypothetical protein